MYCRTIKLPLLYQPKAQRFNQYILLICFSYIFRCLPDDGGRDIETCRRNTINVSKE